MKKVVMPFEGASFQPELLEFARHLNTLSPIMLTAAFVPEVDYAQLWSASGGVAGGVYVPQVLDEGAVIEDHTVKLEAFCAKHDIKLCIHADRFDFALPAIRKEARFADLLVISAVHFFDVISTRQPNVYMKELLHGTECPILLVSETTTLPGDIVLTYDGSEASVFAIKQFAYLFPELASTRTALVHLKEKKDTSLPDRQFIEELMAQHFKNLRILDLHIRPEDFFDNWISAQYNPWLVAGSYGRTDLSRFFSGSFLSDMIRKHKTTLFIAHP